jgi:DeoR/GlpR family transcriptional regulator of sugar metabolism
MAKSPAGASDVRTRAERTAKRIIPNGVALLAEPRRRKILEWLQEEGSARVRDLSDAFSVSEATIRQDLEKLENEGQIVREHGGAYLRSVPEQVRSMALQHLTHMDAKRRIGRAAAALVSDGDSIILDSGSTTTEVAQNLGGVVDLTIITNALNIALMLGASPSCTVHMPGGQFKAPTLSLSGDRSADFFEGLYAKQLFLATAAISLDAGLTYPSMADLPVKRAMIKAASRVCLVADSSKIGMTSFTSLGGLEVVHQLITDDGIRDEDRAAIEALGIDVVVA